jgi:hypothetical protein
MSRPAGPVLDHDDWGKSTRACKWLSYSSIALKTPWS